MKDIHFGENISLLERHGIRIYLEMIDRRRCRIMVEEKLKTKINYKPGSEVYYSTAAAEKVIIEKLLPYYAGKIKKKLS